MLGDWGQGAFIGMVPDFARQFVGRMDEFYLFTRGLSADEVQALYQMNPVGSPGDFNGDGVLDAADIDELTGQVAASTHPALYDLNGDSLVNIGDIGVWVTDLYNSWIGDANLDGEFNSGDLVAVLATGTYEADVDSVWSSGDFNGDGRTNSGDLVAALADGGYEVGPRLPRGGCRSARTVERIVAATGRRELEPTDSPPLSDVQSSNDRTKEARAGPQLLPRGLLSQRANRA
jgi:hypothetical protein